MGWIRQFVIAGLLRKVCRIEAAIYKTFKRKATTAVAQYKHPMKSPVEDLAIILGKYKNADFARATGARILRNMKVSNRLRR